MPCLILSRLAEVKHATANPSANFLKVAQKIMSQIADLLCVDKRAMRSLLKEEARESLRTLHWPPGRLADPVKGIALIEEAQILGYLSLAMTAPTVVVRRLFATRNRDPETAESVLLSAAIQTAFSFPQIRRVCGELPTATPATLAWLLTGWPNQVRRRSLMEVNWTSTGEAANPEPLEPWRDEFLAPASRLLQKAHDGEHDFPLATDRNCSGGFSPILEAITTQKAFGVFEPRASLVIRSAGTRDLLGFVLVSWMHPDCGHVAELAVTPEAQSRGIGKALMLGALDGLWRLGSRTTTLAVSQDNSRAMRLYRSLGFREYHQFPDLQLDRPISPSNENGHDPPGYPLEGGRQPFPVRKAP